MSIHAPAPKPCASCPYRRDVPSGVWSADEYEKLTGYDREFGYQPPAVFQCHQNERDDPKARLCAGWVATHGPDNLLAIRLAPALERMDLAEFAATMNYTTTVAVFASGTEVAEHGMRDIECPSEAAELAIEKIIKQRTDVRLEWERNT